VFYCCFSLCSSGGRVTTTTKLAYNKLDKSSDPPVNRVSFVGEYAVVDGLPRYFAVNISDLSHQFIRNPTGRTGFAGRGLLQYWGPNHCVDPIITRWAVTDAGDFLLADGKRVLEVLLYKHIASGRLLLPGSAVEPDERIPFALVEELIQAVADIPVWHVYRCIVNSL
jgi:hypothetical protein